MGALAGCASAADEGETDWSGETATQEDELWRSWRERRRLPPPEGTGGTGTGGIVTGGSTATGGRKTVDVSGECEVCARAQACCNEVNGGSLCTFSESTCESMKPESRPGYLQSCKTLIQTVAQSRSSIPNACL
ncbi:MAG TPA: hypothetical protein VFZ53_09700 [Polyangiaceae bacterium]